MLLEALLSLFVIVLFFGGGIGIWYYLQKKRGKALENIADQINVNFINNGTEILLDELKKFRLFNLARNTQQYIFNLLQEDHSGIMVSIFDYKYGDGIFIYQQSVIHFRSQNDLFPKFSLLTKDLAEELDKKDSDRNKFPIFSPPELPDTYRLQGPQYFNMQALINKQFLSYLDEHKGFCVEGNDKQLIIYRYCHLVPPKKLSQFMDQGLHIMKLIAKENNL